MSNQGLPGNGFDPALFNAIANNGTGLTPAIAATLSNAQSRTSLNPAQLQQLTEFHRQQSQQQQAQQQRAGLPRHSQTNPLLSLPFPEHVRQHAASLPPGGAEGYLKEWFGTDEGKNFSRAMAAQKHAVQAATQQRPIAPSSMAPTSASPSLGNPAMNTASAGPSSGPSSSAATPERRGSTPIPITQAFTPSNFNIQPRPQTQGPAQPPNPQLHPSLTRPGGVFNSSPGSSQWSSSNLPYRQNMDTRYQHTSVAPRRREDGMRGTMKSELARLMYASGDVENPDTDTIDYMEDMVVDWLAELCAPPPPVRTTPSAPYTIPRLDYEIIRHRLSRPSMRKYLDRFEYMEYKAVDMRSARRVARGNFEPVDQKDLDGQLEKGFLDGENEVAVKKKKKVKRGPGVVAADGGEKKKPGPKKGWKRGGRRGESGSVKPEEV